MSSELPYNPEEIEEILERDETFKDPEMNHFYQKASIHYYHHLELWESGELEKAEYELEVAGKLLEKAELHVQNRDKYETYIEEEDN